MSHQFKCVCGEVMIVPEITKTIVPTPTGGVEKRQPVLDSDAQKFFDGHNSAFGHAFEYIREMS